ncbi:MAG: hypothetical protein AAGG48_30040 [Planctomycetota bacterium]
MRRPYQIRILDLLILTTGVALAIQLWPRTGARMQLVIAGWTALCGLQLFLFRKSLSSAPNERDRTRYAAYVIAYPACFVPIIGWLFVMVSLMLDEIGFNFSVSDSIAPTLFLIAAWGYAVIAIPVSFFTGHNPTNDQMFLWLRIIAMINLIAPLYPAST